MTAAQPDRSYRSGPAHCYDEDGIYRDRLNYARFGGKRTRPLRIFYLWESLIAVYGVPDVRGNLCLLSYTYEDVRRILVEGGETCSISTFKLSMAEIKKQGRMVVQEIKKHPPYVRIMPTIARRAVADQNRKKAVARAQRRRQLAAARLVMEEVAELVEPPSRVKNRVSPMIPLVILRPVGAPRLPEPLAPASGPEVTEIIPAFENPTEREAPDPAPERLEAPPGAGETAPEDPSAPTPLTPAEHIAAIRARFRAQEAADRADRARAAPPRIEAGAFEDLFAIRRALRGDRPDDDAPPPDRGRGP